MSETIWHAIDDGWVLDHNGERICQCADNDEADRLVAATDKLRAELDTLRNRLRWVPVEESLPSLNVRVDVISKYFGVVRDCTRINRNGDGVIVWDNGKLACLSDLTGGTDDVIAWRHIDKPESHL